MHTKTLLGFVISTLASVCQADVFPTSASAFAIDVPVGETVTITSLADYTTAKIGIGTITVTKTGTGKLVFDNRDNAAKINVQEGEVVLARADNKECAHNTTVSPGAKLTFGADNQIRDAAGVTLVGDGMLDVAGHSDTMSYIRCEAPKVDGVVQPLGMAVPQLVNSSGNPVTLTLNNDWQFAGQIDGKIGIVTKHPTARTQMAAVGDGRFESLSAAGRQALAYSTYTAARLVIRDTIGGFGAETIAALGDLTFYNGSARISPDKIKTSTASTTASGRHASAAADDNATTWWNSGTGDAEPTLTFTFVSPQAITGYQLTTGPVLDNMPKSWDLYLRGADDNSWILVDVRRDAAASAYNGSYTRTAGKILTFGDEFGLKLPIGTSSDVIVDGRLDISATEESSVKSLRGTGTVVLADGTVFSPGDTSEWSGVFEAAGEKTAHLQINSNEGGAEQRVKVSGTASVLSIENASEELVSLLVDSASETLKGTLADGKGPMGFVKAGTGEVLTEMSGVDNTGVTEVREGTLSVVSTRSFGNVSTKIIRVRPLSVVGGPNYADTYGYNWSIGSMSFVAEDGTVADLSRAEYSAQTAVDKTSSYDVFRKPDEDNRMIVKCGEDDKTLLGWIKIKTTSPVSFSQMKWRPASAETRTGRTPTAFLVEVSDDEANWTTVCVAHSEDMTDMKDVDGNVIPRGPFALGARASSSAPQVTALPEEFVKTRPASGVGIKSLKAQYFRFHPRMTLGFGQGVYQYGWSVSELDLYLDGVRVSWPATAAVAVEQPDSATAKRLVDNVRSGDDASAVRFFRGYLPDICVINADAVLEFDAYGFTAAGGAYWKDRIPVSWDLYISMDGANWTLVDSVVDKSFDASAEYAALGPWTLTGLKSLAEGQSDALGDRSPVVIQSNARLNIESAYEKFGTLSGAGTLQLTYGAVAEVNALSADRPAFAGSVSGSGSLVISGTGVQTLDGADLSGVTRLVLTGGTLVGTASFGGKDLELVFDGGTLGATLSDIGTLTVVGKPRIALPAIASGETYLKSLISAAFIGVEAQTAFAAPSYTIADGARKDWAAMKVSETSVALRVRALGLIMIFR